jgi:DNA-binding HxlR family transcriptional regulator
VPPRVEYALTGKGRDLAPLIEDMREYGKRWLCLDEEGNATAVEGARESAAEPTPVA